MQTNANLFLATSNCIAICEHSTDGWRVVRRDLMGNYATCVLALENQILVGTRSGIFRSDDGGDSWRAVNSGLNIRHIRWMAGYPGDQSRIFAGSEPAGIFTSVDGGNSWRNSPSVEALRDAEAWYLPYSPEAGCVRGFALSTAKSFAAVEVGGLLVTDDDGETWSLNTEPDSEDYRIHPDVHSIETHPGSTNLVAAATGGGLYYSSDGGKTWENRYPGSYCRALWWDSNDANHILLGSADWVDRNGRVEESWDGGTNWRLASDGFSIPWRKNMVERFVQAGNDLIAVLSNGELWLSSLQQLFWRRLLPEVRDIKAASFYSMKERDY
jgi:photosystem II stability/assembly factor-like uncharacterized protein